MNQKKSNWPMWALTFYGLAMIFVIFESWMSFNSIFDSERKNLSSLTIAVDKQISEMLGRVDLQLENLEQQIEITKFNKTYSQENLHTKLVNLRQKGEFIVVGYSDPSGAYISSSEALKPNVSVADREYFKSLQSNPDLMYAISEPVISKSTGKWAIIFAKKRLDPKGKFAGVILVALEAKRIENTIASMYSREGGAITIYDKSKKLIARWPSIPELTGKVVQYDTSKSEAGEIQFAERPSPVDQVNRLVAIKSIFENRWVLTVGASKDALLAKWRVKVYTYITIFFALLGTLLWLRKAHRNFENFVTQQQMQLVQSSKLSSLGEMAGGIAHEINNPMAIIRASADLVQLELSQNERPYNRKLVESMLKKIDTASQRVEKIIKSMRKVAREGLHEPCSSVTIRSMIDSVLDLCATRFHNYNIRLSVLTNLETAVIECREVQVEQILINLLNNAFDAVDGQKDPWVTIDYSDSGEFYEIAVSNSGPAIPSDVQARMMQPFFTTKAPGKGTGLGLSISKQIATSHGGDLYLDEGADNPRFILRLPKTQPQQAVQQISNAA